MSELGATAAQRLGRTVWVCARCNSIDLQISVEWCDSLEGVDQLAETLEPAECSAERSRVVTGFCNSCGAQGPASEVIVRGENTGIRPPSDGLRPGKLLILGGAPARSPRVADRIPDTGRRERRG